MLITIPFQYVAFRIFAIVALTIPSSSINISTLISFCSVIVLFIITTSWYENAFLITGPFWVLTFCGCPIERAINMFFFVVVNLNKLSNKQSIYCWPEMHWRSRDTAAMYKRLSRSTNSSEFWKFPDRTGKTMLNDLLWYRYHWTSLYLVYIPS